MGKFWSTFLKLSLSGFLTEVKIGESGFKMIVVLLGEVYYEFLIVEMGL